MSLYELNMRKEIMFYLNRRKQDEQIGVYYQTNDYSKFSIIESNRDIKPQHVERLKKSIQEIGLVTPIQVDKDFIIVDGQHRFDALKALGYPITYQILDYDIDPEKIMIDVNINSENWGNDDFCKRWAAKEQKENPTSYMSMPYNIFQQFRNHKLHNMSLITLIYGSYADVHTKSFKSGKLKIKNKIQFRKDAEYLSLLMVTNKPNNVCGQRNFQVAMCRDYLNNENFDRKKFLKKVEKHPYKLEKRSAVRDYAENIRDVYNWCTKKGKLI